MRCRRREVHGRPPVPGGGYVPHPRFIVGVGPSSPSADLPRTIGWRVLQPSDWRALTLGVGTALVQRLVMEQPRPFDVDVAEAALRCEVQQAVWRVSAENPMIDRSNFGGPKIRAPSTMLLSSSAIIFRLSNLRLQRSSDRS